MTYTAKNLLNGIMRAATEGIIEPGVDVDAKLEKSTLVGSITKDKLTISLSLELGTAENLVELVAAHLNSEASTPSSDEDKPEPKARATRRKAPEPKAEPEEAPEPPAAPEPMPEPEPPVVEPEPVKAPTVPSSPTPASATPVIGDVDDGTTF